MLTTRPTPEMCRRWKRMFEQYRIFLRPDRRSGAEVDAYFRSKYPFHPCVDPEFREVVKRNIMENEYFRTKLPHGTSPQINTYVVGAVLVGIDTVGGYFQVECADMEKAAPIYDDLFVYRGLDEDDLQNFFLVAQYVLLTEGRRCGEQTV